MPGRWPPLEKRIVAVVAEDGGLTRAALTGRLEAVAGNEWLIDEAVADLIASGGLREDEGADGSRTLRA